jgi:hypothetical protein
MDPKVSFVDNKSLTGVLVYLYRCLISFRSKKQHCAAKSSTES